MSIPLGLAACALSSLLFGSMFVPVKKYSPGNGIFVQWVMSAAILFVGLIVYSTQGFPEFEPLAMLGGVFWALGNVTAVPIMNTIGIGMGMLVWGTTNCVAGWAAGRFGLFGINATIPAMPVFNYIGLFLVIIGGILFSQIRPTAESSVSERSPLMAEPSDDFLDSPTSDVVISSIETRDNKKRIIAIATSLVAGIFYGITFVPVIYIQDHPIQYPTAPKQGLGFVFSHFVGIFVTASIFLITYIIYSKNNPYSPGSLLGPGLLAGFMWGTAQSSWFVANDNLSQAVSFPIVTMVPGVIAALWSVFYFRDIQGKRNLRLLSVAVGITVIGAILVGISK